VRFYERQGLVASERLANGYRTCDREAIDVLRFINRAKVLGFSLEEVREILTVRRTGTAPCTRVTKMIKCNLAAIDQRIAELSVLRRQPRPSATPASDLPDHRERSIALMASIAVTTQRLAATRVMSGH